MKKVALVAFFIVVVAFALGHVWLVNRGVHFKGKKVDFGAPPARYAIYFGSSMSSWPAWRPGTTYLKHVYAWSEEHEANQERAVKAQRHRIDHVYALAEHKEANGQYASAANTWVSVAKEPSSDVGMCKRRAALLRLLADHPRLKGARSLLLATRPIHPKGTLPELSQLAFDLRPFAIYEQITEKTSPSAAASGYFSIANEYPHSPLVESALIMVPRTLLGDGNVHPTESDIAVAQSAMDKLATRFPHSRFRADIVGWRGRVFYLHHQYVPALLQYRRQFQMSSRQVAKHGPLESIILCEQELNRAPRIAAAYLLRYGLTNDESVRLNALGHLPSIFDRFGASDGKAFWTLLREDPYLLTLYLDYRLGNTKATPDLLALARLNDRRALNSPYKGRLLTLLSEAAYRLQKVSLAKQYAIQALPLCRTEEDAARTHFMLGSVARRTGDSSTAIRRFETILHRYPKSYLCDGARENLALLFERTGRFAEALETYQRLDYTYDVAYLLDIRMKPRQIANYIATHPHAKDKKVWVFSLGMRYLRNHDWARAERTLRRLSRSTRLAMVKHNKDYWYDDSDEPDPLKTARDLRRLNGRVAAAKTSNRRANALMATANYYYNHRNLLLYNPVLWEGDRAYAISYSWNWKVATRQDDKALEQHHWDHECLAQALLICRKIVKDYPHSPVHFEAAYRGSCAAEHLAGFNAYWRWSGDRLDLYKEAVRMMKVASGSPDRGLSIRARKYAHVFAEERSGAREAFKESNHSRRWHAEWEADEE